MKEIWKDIEGFEALYQISNLGRVRSLDRFVKSIHDSNRLVKGRILKVVKNIRGNEIVSLSKDSQIHTFSISKYLKTNKL
mgnify:CR=1 FL=1